MFSYVLFPSLIKTRSSKEPSAPARLCFHSPGAQNHDNNLLSFAVPVPRVDVNPKMPTADVCTQESIASD
jgi:hypothetical protein